jgi:hypothetical protein
MDIGIVRPAKTGPSLGRRLAKLPADKLHEILAEWGVRIEWWATPTRRPSPGTWEAPLSARRHVGAVGAVGWLAPRWRRTKTVAGSLTGISHTSAFDRCLPS